MTPPSPGDAERGQYLQLAAAVLLAMSLWFSASAVVPQLAAHWALDPSRQGWLTASVQLGFVAGALASALLGLADRVPVNRLIATSALLAALCNAAITLPGLPYAAALALRALTGALLAGVYPPAMKLVASWTRARRGLWVGVLIGALTLGSALPHLLNAAGASAAAAGTGADAAAAAAAAVAAPWAGLLRAASLLALVGAALALPLRTGPFVSAGAGFHWREVPALLGRRAVLLANVGYLGHMWELYAMWTWVPIYLGLAFADAGLGRPAAAWTAFAVIAVGAPGCIAAGWLADRIGRSLTTMLAMALSGASALAAAASYDLPVVLAVVCLVWGLTVIADSAQFSAALSELAEPTRVGTALTLQTALGFLLTLGSIQLVPVIAARGGWPAAMAVLALGPACGIAAMWRLRALPEAKAMAGGRR